MVKIFNYYFGVDYYSSCIWHRPCWQLFAILIANHSNVAHRLTIDDHGRTTQFLHGLTMLTITDIILFQLSFISVVSCVQICYMIPRAWSHPHCTSPGPRHAHLKTCLPWIRTYLILDKWRWKYHLLWLQMSS